MMEATQPAESAPAAQLQGEGAAHSSARTSLWSSLAGHWRLDSLRKYAPLWIGTAAVITAAAAVYAVVRPDIWRASQAIVVRDEAIGNFSRQGRFDSADAMKTAQETILEIARSPAVVEGALRQVGPDKSARAAGAWPSNKDVQETQSVLQITAPKGAEFGRTELIYLSIDAREKSRARELAVALFDQLEARLKHLRNAKAQSVIDELTRTAALAENELAGATSRLQLLEQEVGSDLGELRTLNDSGAGDSNLRVSLNQIKNSLSAARAAQADTEKQYEILVETQQGAVELNGIPNKLLDTLPSLRRLREGLVDAQLRTSQLAGTMNEQHPLLQAAIAAEQEVRNDLRAELAAAVNGLRADLEVNQAQIESLEQQYAEVAQRLDKLAGLRARYANLAAEVRHRGDILEKARRDLAEAHAARSAAQSASLLSRVDAPVVGDYPVGPRRSMIVAAGLAGGLFAGLGLVFLLAPRNDGRGRRFSDRFRSRRAGDMVASGRRAEDRPSPPPPAIVAALPAPPTSVEPPPPPISRSPVSRTLVPHSPSLDDSRLESIWRQPPPATAAPPAPAPISPFDEAPEATEDPPTKTMVLSAPVLAAAAHARTVDAWTSLPSVQPPSVPENETAEAHSVETAPDALATDDLAPDNWAPIAPPPAAQPAAAEEIHTSPPAHEPACEHEPDCEHDPLCQYDAAWAEATSQAPSVSRRPPVAPGAPLTLTDSLRKLVANS